MSRKILVVSAVVGAVALACAEGTGPLGDDSVSQPPVASSATPHFLKWETAHGPMLFRAVAGTPQGEEQIEAFLGPARSAGDSLALDTYNVSFWAVLDEFRYVQINYLAEGEAAAPFLRLEIIEPEELPDGTELGHGDSVLVTVSVDPYDIRVELMPHGLVFGEPARLKIWYGGADGDFNDDGVIDQQDADIEANLLGMWYRPTPGESWTSMSSEHNLSEQWFRASLRHFSGYAVSWME